MFFAIKRIRTNIHNNHSKNLDNTPTLFLPPELIFLIVEQLPDIQSAKGLFGVDKATNNFFKTYLSAKSSRYRFLKKEAQFYSNLNQILTWRLNSIPVLMFVYLLGIGGMAYFSYLVVDKALEMIIQRGKLKNEPVIQVFKIPCLFIATIAGTVVPIPSLIQFIEQWIQKTRRKSNHLETELNEFIKENTKPINWYK